MFQLLLGLHCGDCKIATHNTVIVLAILRSVNTLSERTQTYGGLAVWPRDGGRQERALRKDIFAEHHLSR